MVNTENSIQTFRNDVFYAYTKSLHDQEELLNKQSELILKCRHENKFLLTNYKALIIKLFNSNTCAPSILGVFRTVHHSYLPDDSNNVKPKVVSSVVIISLFVSIYMYLYIIYIYIRYI